VKQAKSSVKRAIRRISPFQKKKQSDFQVAWNEVEIAYGEWRQHIARLSPQSARCIPSSDFWQYVKSTRGDVNWLDTFQSAVHYDQPGVKEFVNRILDSATMRGIDENMKEVWDVFDKETCREYADVARTKKQTPKEAAETEWGSVARHFKADKTLSDFFDDLLGNIIGPTYRESGRRKIKLSPSRPRRSFYGL